MLFDFLGLCPCYGHKILTCALSPRLLHQGPEATNGGAASDKFRVKASGIQGSGCKEKV